MKNDLGFRKVKLSGNCIIVTCPFMILSLNGFDDSRSNSCRLISLEFSLTAKRRSPKNVQNLFIDRSGHYSTAGKLKYLSVY